MQKLESNKKDWTTFDLYIQETLGCIIGLLPNGSASPNDITQNMEGVRVCVSEALSVLSLSDVFFHLSALHQIQQEIQALQNAPPFKYALSAKHSPA